MSLNTTSKKSFCLDKISEEINRIQFMIDNLKKEKAEVTGKPLSSKRKYVLITEDVEYDSYEE